MKINLKHIKKKGILIPLVITILILLPEVFGWNNYVRFWSITNTFFNNTSVGAFLGSFSAFIFGLIAYDFTKKRERWAIHHNSLVRTEQLINRHLDDISSNIFLLKGSIDAYARNVFSENQLTPLENPDYMIDFYNLQLSNTYLEYQSLVTKINHDMQGWNRSNDRLFTLALSGRASLVDISQNRVELSKRSHEILKHLNDLLNLTYTTGAYVRKFIDLDKRDKFARLKPTEMIKITQKQIEKERKVFYKESLENMEKDRKERLNKYKKVG